MLDRSALSLVCIALGVFTIATRAPLLFAPKATLRVVDMLLATNTRIRVVGVFLGGVALAILGALRGASAGTALSLLSLLGWIMAFACAFLLVAPRGYRALVVIFLDEMRDGELARVLGGFGVIAGLAIVWMGFALD